MENKEKYLYITVIVLSVILIVVKAFTSYEPKKEITDQEKFNKEYPKVDKINMFKYRSLEEANNLIENESGYFFFCNKENKNCEDYALYLFEEASDLAMSDIYYVDIKKDKDSNSEAFNKLKELLKDYNEDLNYPFSVAVYKKKIVGFNNTTSNGEKNYWNKETIEAFKIEIMKYMNKINENICDEECTD